MPPSSDDPDEARSATERASFITTREHVGAAGFAQRDALERLIHAGREQIEFTYSLRQVLTTTLAQLHALPLQELHQTASTHVAALETIVKSSSSQLRTARDLRGAIQRTLAQVRGTPIEQISALVLTNLSEVVHRQAADLEALIALASREAGTVQQIALFEALSVESRARLLRTEHEQDLAHLDEAGRNALDRIWALENDGVSLSARRAQLEHDAASSRERITGLEASVIGDSEEITRLETQADVSRARTAELEAAASKTQKKISRLRQQIEAQHRREHELERQAEDRQNEGVEKN